MEKVFSEILKVIDEKKPFVVATIIEANGSVPRKEGATMILKSDGSFSGTIGGGSAENQGCEDAKEVMRTKKDVIKEYHSSKPGTGEEGMICGGDIKVSFRYIEADDKEFEKEFHEYLDKVDAGTVKVYIYGAGHVAQAVVPLATKVGFKCIVSDDRENMLTKEIFPDAYELRHIDFTKLGEKLPVTERDFVCIMTKGHKDDYNALMPAMRSDAYYIGMLGSRAKVAALQKKLKEEGFSEERIKDCKSPIGTNISAETPDEVAISIVGEMIYYRAEMENRLKYK